MADRIDWSIRCPEIATGEGARGFVEIRWDDQDPNNLGYAYWDDTDSGELDGGTLSQAIAAYEEMLTVGDGTLKPPKT